MYTSYQFLWSLRKVLPVHWPPLLVINVLVIEIVKLLLKLIYLYHPCVNLIRLINIIWYFLLTYLCHYTIIFLFHGHSQHPRRNTIVLNEPLEFRKKWRILIRTNFSMIFTILSPYNVHLSGWWGQVGLHLKIVLPLLSYCPVGTQG